MSELALLGGRPVRVEPYPEYNPIGEEEVEAVAHVVRSGLLSGFIGSHGSAFHGGPEVFALESEWAEHFHIKHAIAVNSATSGLYAAVAALALGPGDEVIVPPFTMSATATAALTSGATPVFADVDSPTFCLSPVCVREQLTDKTRAIISVNLFGYPGTADIMEIAKEHDLFVIEDNAQAPGAGIWDGDRGFSHAGTFGDIGIFSLNQHKIIHCGEGGVVVTNDDVLADKLRLIRNHGEVVLQGRPQVKAGLEGLVGYNYRMTEVEAAIAREQLKRLRTLVEHRARMASTLTWGLKRLLGISPPPIAQNIRHAYWRYAVLYSDSATGVPRKRFAGALRAEGIPVSEGYVEPIYNQPIYNDREIAPCSIAEYLHRDSLLLADYCHAGVTRDDIQDVIAAYTKVIENVKDLQY